MSLGDREFTPLEIAAFVGGAKDGDFDHLTA
jgi:hypothetical protein